MNSSTKRLRQYAMVAATVGSLAAPGAALAASAQPSADGYGLVGGQIQQDVAGKSPATTGQGGAGNQPANAGADQGSPADQGTVSSASDSNSNLPFTGMDVALLLGAGGIFLGAGLAMRRLARKPNLA